MKQPSFPLNESGEEMSYEELVQYIKSLPKPESPLCLEDVAFFVEGDLDEFIKSIGAVPLNEFMNKRKEVKDMVLNDMTSSFETDYDQMNEEADRLREKNALVESYATSIEEFRQAGYDTSYPRNSSTSL